MIERTIRWRAARVLNQNWEIFCERKRTICAIGSLLCLAVMINDVPTRSDQTMNLFAGLPGRIAPFGNWLSIGSARTPENGIWPNFLSR